MEKLEQRLGPEPKQRDCGGAERYEEREAGTGKSWVTREGLWGSQGRLWELGTRLGSWVGEQLVPERVGGVAEPAGSDSWGWGEAAGARKRLWVLGKAVGEQSLGEKAGRGVRDKEQGLEKLWL